MSVSVCILSCSNTCSCWLESLYQEWKNSDQNFRFREKKFDNILFRVTQEPFLEAIVGTTETPQQQRSVAENIGACRRPHCHYSILYYNQLLLAVQLAAVIPQSLRQQSQGQSSLSGTTQKGIIIPSCLNVSTHVNRI